MPGEINMALNAINQPLNTKESKYRELSTLLQFDKRLEEDSQKEMASEMAYTQYEESVNAFSESLLEGDRAQIKNKARDLQGQLKNEISKAGSYRKFMENGGVRLLSKYKDQVVNSQEAKTYADNAKHMAHIIKARDAGKGNLLLNKDLKALQDYEVNGYGKLSYNGLLSEVDMPNPQAYEFGKYAEPGDILANENNYSAILSNFMREFPEKGTPTNDQLVEYTAQKYKLKGTNTQILAMKQANENRARKAAAAKAKKADKRMHSIWTLQTNEMNNLNGAGLDGKAKGFHPNSDFEEIYSKKSTAGIVTNRKFEQFAEAKNPGLFSFDTDAMRLKGATINGAFDGTWKKALKDDGYAGERLNEDGTYNFNPANDGFFGADGRKTEIDESVRLQPINVVTAAKYKDKDGREQYATEFVNGKGAPKVDENKEYYDQISEDTKAFMEPTEVWKDEDGRLYYRPIHQDSISIESSFTNSISDEDDVSDRIIIEQQMKADKNIKAAQLNLQKAFIQRDIKNTYGSDEFKNSMNDKIIDKFSFPSNENIFGPMTMAFAMANKTFTGGKNEDGSYKVNATGASANEVDQANDFLGTLFTPVVINKLRDKNLTMEKAYAAMSTQMQDLTDDEDKEAMNLLLAYWKPLYESKSGNKFNIETE